MNYLLAHPALLLWAFPFVVGAVVKFIGNMEKVALERLFSYGDADDRAAIRATADIWVKWAERRAAPNADGSSKFAVVDKLLARGLPFLSAEDRRSLIEKCVAEMDAAANAELAKNDPASDPRK